MIGWRLFGDGTATRRCRYGTVTYLENDIWHGRALAKYGEWSEGEVALWRRLLPRGAVAADVGAHIGCHTLALASIVGPDGVVHAFEPQRRVAELLERNVRQNALAGRVFVYRVALGETLGSARYAAPNYKRAGNFGAVAVGADGDVTVPVMALDAMADMLPRLDFIKLDVEGAEAAVVAGARGLITKFRPTIYAEADRRDAALGLFRALAGLGYRWMWHLPPLFNPGNFARDPQNIFGRVVSQNIVAVPRERAGFAWAVIADAEDVVSPEDLAFDAEGRLAWTGR